VAGRHEHVPVAEDAMPWLVYKTHSGGQPLARPAGGHVFNRLPELVNEDARIRRRGRYVSTTFLAQAGERSWLIRVDRGRVDDVREGPFVMPRWTFALRAEPETWAAFWQPVPAPGFHDLMAMIKFKTLVAEGDLYPLMSNLLWFKDLLSAPRRLSTTPAATQEP
jgi:hypothetical protein